MAVSLNVMRDPLLFTYEGLGKGPAHVSNGHRSSAGPEKQTWRQSRGNHSPSSETPLKGHNQHSERQGRQPSGTKAFNEEGLLLSLSPVFSLEGPWTFSLSAIILLFQDCERQTKGFSVGWPESGFAGRGGPERAAMPVPVYTHPYPSLEA